MAKSSGRGEDGGSDGIAQGQGDGTDDSNEPAGPANHLAIQIPLPARADKPSVMSATAAESSNQQLLSPLPTPTLPTPTSAPGASSANRTTLPTIPSDEDSCSSDVSSRSHRGRPPSSGSSSSVSEEGQDGKDNADKTSKKENAEAPPMKKTNSQDHIRRLSAAEMQQFVAAPESLPVAVVVEEDGEEEESKHKGNGHLSPSELQTIRKAMLEGSSHGRGAPGHHHRHHQHHHHHASFEDWRTKQETRRPAVSSRTLSTPPINRNQPATAQTSPRRNSFNPAAGGRPVNLRSLPSTPILKPPPPPLSNRKETHQESPVLPSSSSSMHPSIPLPPMSLPTYLQLELASQRPSQLYIHRPENFDVPYESAAVKFERLLNALLLPPYLERTLTFGTLACLDAWLYNFTILPIRFLVAVSILAKWWGHVISKEVKWITGFVWYGLGRLWVRGTSKVPSPSAEPTPLPADEDALNAGASSSSAGAHYDSSSSRGPFSPDIASSGVENHMVGSNGHAKSSKRSKHAAFRHRRTKSMPSNLTVYNKADLLQGAVIIFSTVAMMKMDASRMYHFIRGQSDIKLYVIYNILEVGDKLLSAVGQDIFECLLSSETLSRNSSGRSKVMVPMGMFLLALVYNILHSVALYFHVITLNVAVNSYHNALLTLLMSNQFVEVKGTVFKRIERDNLFQLTCADIVERFQLWIMLLIIGMRNIVEVGGLSVPGAASGDVEVRNTIPLHSPSILPYSFTVLPNWLWSGEVLSPFLIILGSEILVDSIKHAYATKFNVIKRRFYSRILDILCKDYYTNAFVTPALTRRLGLAVIPLSCLFIRASFQTYHMFISTRISPPLPPSTQTSLSEESAVPSSPAIIAALDRFDTLIRDALGRSVYGYPSRARSWWDWTRDDVIAALTMVVVFFLVFLVLLMVKLLLGMLLLAYSRNRYAKMVQKEQMIARGQAERESYEATGAKRIGGRGDVELGDDRRRWLNVDENEGLKKRPKPNKPPESEMGDYQGVARYEMVAKRIW